MNESRLFALTIFMILAVASVAPIFSTSEQPTVGILAGTEGTLHVNVTDHSGRPLRNANVTVDGVGGYALTNLTGEAVISNISAIPGGQAYTVNINKLGYLSNSTSATIFPDLVTNISMYLSGGGVAGRITSSQTVPILNPPIANATIQIFGYINGEFIQDEARSGLNGLYALKDLPTGTYQIIAFAPGFEGAPSIIGIVAGSSIVQDITLGSLSGAIYGHVMEGLEAVVSAEVSIMINGIRHSILTDSSGGYYISSVPTGNYTVTASKVGYKESTVPGIIINKSEEKNLTLQLVSLPATISGTVIASLPGGTVLVYGATVEIVELTMSKTTSVQGGYSIDGIPHGIYTLRTTAPGYEDNTTIIMLGRGANITLNIALDPKPGRLTGTIKSQKTLDPIENCRVVIYFNGQIRGERYTNIDGQYVFADLAPGNYTITVVAPESEQRYSPYVSGLIEISSEGDTELDVYLSLAKQELGGFILGMDLPHSFMVLSFCITIIILAVAVFLRLKKISKPEDGAMASKDEAIDELDEEIAADGEENKDEGSPEG